LQASVSLSKNWGKKQTINSGFRYLSNTHLIEENVMTSPVVLVK